jgi:hypothetical protein
VDVDLVISGRFAVIWTCYFLIFSTAPSDASVACVETTLSSFEVH